MSARVCDIRDACSTALQAAWTAAALSPMPNVYTDYVPDVMDPESPSALPAGINVFLYPASYGYLELATRAEFLSGYGIACLVISRYASQGTPPNSWIDELVAFTENYVYQVLGDVRGTPILTGVWADTAEVPVVFDAEEMYERKLFWSELAFVFNEVK